MGARAHVVLRRWRLLTAPWRRVRPTPEGWVFFACCFAVALAATNTGNNLLYLIFGTMLAFVALSGVLSEVSIRQLEVERLLPLEIVAGRPASGRWRIRNGKGYLPALAVDLDEVWAGPNLDPASRHQPLPYLQAGCADEVLGQWTFRRRGEVALWGVRVSTCWPFGILRKSYLLHLPQEVLVYPQPRPGGIVRTLAGPEVGQGQAGTAVGNEGFRDLAAYRPGDDKRRIHWPSSARRDDLLVVRGEGAACGRVEVSLRPVAAEGRPPGSLVPEDDPFERAVSEAAHAIEHALQVGEEVVLRLPRAVLGPAHGELGRRQLMEALARLPRGGRG